MRYPNYEPRVNVILDLARAAREVEKAFPGTSASDFIQHLDQPASSWAWSLVEIIMDLEEEAKARGVNDSALE